MSAIELASTIGLIRIPETQEGYIERISPEKMRGALIAQDIAKAQFVLDYLNNFGDSTDTIATSLITADLAMRQVGVGAKSIAGEEISQSEYLWKSGSESEWTIFLDGIRHRKTIDLVLDIARDAILYKEIRQNPDIQSAFAIASVYFRHQVTHCQDQGDEYFAEEYLRSAAEIAFVLDTDANTQLSVIDDLWQQSQSFSFSTKSSDHIAALGMIIAMQNSSLETIFSWSNKLKYSTVHIPNSSGMSYSVALSDDTLRGVFAQFSQNTLSKDEYHFITTINKVFDSEMVRLWQVCSDYPTIFGELRAHPWLVSEEYIAANHTRGNRFEILAAINDKNADKLIALVSDSDSVKQMDLDNATICRVVQRLYDNEKTDIAMRFMQTIIDSKIQGSTPDKVDQIIGDFGWIAAYVQEVNNNLQKDIESYILSRVSEKVHNDFEVRRQHESERVQQVIEILGNHKAFIGLPNVADRIDQLMSMFHAINAEEYAKVALLKEKYYDSRNAMHNIFKRAERQLTEEQSYYLYEVGHPSISNRPEFISMGKIDILMHVISLNNPAINDGLDAVIAHLLEKKSSSADLVSLQGVWAASIHGDLPAHLLIRDDQSTQSRYVSEMIATLKLSPPYTEKTVRAAYFRAVQQYHPDKSENELENFLRAQKSYEVLTAMAKNGELASYDVKNTHWWEELPSIDSLIIHYKAAMDAKIEDVRTQKKEVGKATYEKRYERPSKGTSKDQHEDRGSRAKSTRNQPQDDFVRQWASRAAMEGVKSEGDTSYIDLFHQLFTDIPGFESMLADIAMRNDTALDIWIGNAEVDPIAVEKWRESDLNQGPGGFYISWLIKSGILTLTPIARGGTQLARMEPGEVGSFGINNGMIAVTGLYREPGDRMPPRTVVAYGASSSILRTYLHEVGYMNQNNSVADMMDWQFNRSLDRQKQFLSNVSV